MRCYRYMTLDHTRPHMTLDHTRPQYLASADREVLCFRCGREGNKAAACEETTPRCAVYVESYRPVGHVMGSRRCKPATTKGRTTGARAPQVAASAVAAEGVVLLPADG